MESWNAEQQNEYALRHLRAMLIRAKNGSPFYARRFREAGFDPAVDLRRPEDLVGLPLVTKQQLREYADEVIDRRFARWSMHAETSGTTGQPFSMLLNERHVAYDSAAIYRHWSWGGYSFRDPVVAIRSYVPEKGTEPLWRYSRSQNTWFFSAYHLTPSNSPQYVERMLDFNPKIIRGYPSSVSLLAEYAYAQRKRFTNLEAVIVSSETLLDSERETIEGTFGPRLLNWYGMTEPAMILTECPAHEGMHINWDYGYTELLTAPELSSDERRLVTTSYHNPVMPFIRYDTGDVVKVFEGEKRCSCGRTLPLVRGVLGRKDECLLTPDGRRLPSVNFYTVFRKYKDVLRFQMIQYGTTSLSVKLLVKPESGPLESLRSTIHEEIRSRVGEAVDIRVEFTESFVTNSDGKTPPILRRPGTRAVEEKEEYSISSQLAWRLEEMNRPVLKLDWNESDVVPSPAVRQAIEKVIQREHSICWY
ncbi:MAG: hypothetical protein A3G41_03415, partial [Elusimicrobia bacterium RIFCSPLOWO2_12_FULL_59_9]